jgi:hypothetical protein
MLFKNKIKNTIINKSAISKQSINLIMNSQTQIDFRTVPINVPSLCIPRVYPNISEDRIRKIFDELALGTIDHLDIISRTTDKGEKFNRVFIHFRSWYTDGNAGVARERLLNGKDIKIIYDDPWFWKVSAYREQQASAARPEPRQYQNHSQKKPTILFEDEDHSKKPRNHYEDQRQRPRPGSSYDDDRRIKQHSQGRQEQHVHRQEQHVHRQEQHVYRQEQHVHRQENFQTARPKPELGGFKKVSKSDIQDTQVSIRPLAPTIAPQTIAPTLKVEVEAKAVEVKKEKEEEDEMMKQKVPPKKKLRAIAKKPLLKVEEPEEQNVLEDGEIVTNEIEN